MASARAGNVIGGGDWALDRLVPDIMRACFEEPPASPSQSAIPRPCVPGSTFLSRSPDISPGRASLSPMAPPSPRHGTSVLPTPMRGRCSYLVSELARLWGDGCSWQCVEAGEESTKRICCASIPPRPAPDLAGLRAGASTRPSPAPSSGTRLSIRGQDVRACTLNQIQSFMQQAKCYNPRRM